MAEAWAKLMRWEKFGTAWDPPIPATVKPLILIVLVMIAVQAISNLVHDWRHVDDAHDALDDIDIDIDAIRQAEEKIDGVHPPQR